MEEHVTEIVDYLKVHKEQQTSLSLLMYSRSLMDEEEFMRNVIAARPFIPEVVEFFRVYSREATNDYLTLMDMHDAL